VVLAQDSTATGEGVILQLAGPLVLAQRSRRRLACPGPLSYYLDGLDRRHRDAAQIGDQLSDDAMPKTPMPSTSFASGDWRGGTITLVKPAC
jgi:hypothetical protein